MAVTQYLVDFDRLFAESEQTNIVVNDLVSHNLPNLSDENILNSIMTVYDRDMFSTIPKCDCTEDPLEGSFYEGVVCDVCGKEVKHPYDSIRSELWLRSIFVDGVEVKLMSPIFYHELSMIFLKKKRGFKEFNYLEYILDTSVSIPEPYLNTDVAMVVESMIGNVMDGKRGYLNFMSKLGECLDFLKDCVGFNNKHKALNAKIMIEDMGITPDNMRGILSSHLPILSNRIFVMENSPKGKFVNLKASMSLSIVKNWTNLCRDIKNAERLKGKPITVEKVGNVAAKIAKISSELFIDVFKDDIMKKQGVSRRQIYGYKVIWCFRGVIVSRNGSKLWSPDKLIGNDPIDGIDIPWKAAIGSLELHLTNKLLRRGYSVREIRERLDLALTKYDEEVHELLLEIMNEAPGGKIPVLGIRNPTLLRGSLMLMHIRSIKTDVRDETIGLNPLVVKVFNGDFDGDNMSFMMIFDQRIVDLLEGFRHQYSLFSIKSPCSIAGFLTSLATGNQVISNFLRESLDNPNEDKLYDMILSNRKK